MVHKLFVIFKYSIGYNVINDRDKPLSIMNITLTKELESFVWEFINYTGVNYFVIVVVSFEILIFC